MPNDTFATPHSFGNHTRSGLNNIKSGALFAVALLCVVVIQGTLPLQPFDDAFITFRYARNISNGLGFVYNQGENVLGTTTPLFTLLLSLISYLSQPEYIPKASFIISVVADALNVWLLFRLSNWIFKDKVIAVITSIVFLLQPFRLNVATGGMETSLFITCLLFSYDRYTLGDRSLSTSFWAALSILIRPDAVIALVPLFIDWLVCDQRGCRNGVLITGLLISPWILWSTLNFGSPIPHSIIAKSVSYKNPLGQAVFYLLTFLGTGTPGPYSSPFLLLPGLILGLPVLFIGTWILIKNCPRGLVLGFYPILYIVVMTILNPSMYFSWYYIPLMPGMLILIMTTIWYGLKISRKVKIIIASTVSLLLLILPTFLLDTRPNWPLSRAREEVFWDACNTIADHNSGDIVVLAPDIGVIGWCLTEVKILDPIGLVSPESIPYGKDLLPEQLISPRLIFDKQPEYIVSLDQFVNPYLLSNQEFIRSYKIIYEIDVQIVETEQSLYVFQLDSDREKNSD